jgi:hypothetical protein
MDFLELVHFNHSNGMKARMIRCFAGVVGDFCRLCGHFQPRGKYPEIFDRRPLVVRGGILSAYSLRAVSRGTLPELRDNDTGRQDEAVRPIAQLPSARGSSKRARAPDLD